MVCPEADLYVFTGDMLDNFPVAIKDKYRYQSWKIDPAHESKMQKKFVEQFVKDGGMSRFLGSPDSPIIAVRGNHDFIDISELFDGCNFVHEFVNNELIEILGIKATGHRGIPHIGGYWNDEVQRPELKERFRSMPQADLYLTHYALSGMLDANVPPGQSGYGSRYESYGLEGSLVDMLVSRGNKALHMFGHIHECGGMTESVVEVQFSNAATSINVIEF